MPGCEWQGAHEAQQEQGNRGPESYKSHVTGSLRHDLKLIEILYFQMPLYLAQ